MKKIFSPNIIVFAALFAIFTFAAVGQVSAQLPGAIFTTENSCNGTNINIFDSKAEVYLDGGPRRVGSAGLPSGLYYVQVTTPDNALLGTSVGTTNETPVLVNANGEFAVCYQLSTILRKASNQTPGPIGPDGYDTTTNQGGVYKVWISTESSFNNNTTKTDNFKVEEETCEPNCSPQEISTLQVQKFYDTDTDGVKDEGEVFIEDWKVRILSSTIDLIRFTPATVIVEPDTYTVSEFPTIETNWLNTTPTSQSVMLANNETKTVTFGNVCVGAGGGMTLGFWSNKNGQSLIGADDLEVLRSLFLRNADGSEFNPMSREAVKSWLLAGSATNMAYMLSVQLTAMELNVLNGKVVGTRLIYAPGLPTVTSTGFASVNTIMAAAADEIEVHANTTSGQPGDEFRGYQEALKNALDRANNNLNFVQSAPCAFSFAE